MTPPTTSDVGTQTLNAPTSSNTLWTKLYTEDFDQLAANLRAAGFPPKIARLIMQDCISRRAEAAYSRIEGKRDLLPYWLDSYSISQTPEERAELSKLWDEQFKAYKKYDNRIDALREDEALLARARRRYGNISIEKIQRVDKTNDDYEELRREIYRKLDAGKQKEYTETDRAKLALLTVEERRDIQQLLTSEEYEQYQLRSSFTAVNLRRNLELFKPTEAEYIALFRLNQPLDEQFIGSFGENKAAYDQAREKLKPQLEAVLGPERYADYVQATEHGTDKLNRLMARLDLPLSTAGKITAVRQDITERADAIRNDLALDPADRANRLTALAQEAKNKLTATLGSDRGYRAYDDLKGDWIRALQPKP